MSSPTGKIVIDAVRCKGCGLCIDACPKGKLRLGSDPSESGTRKVMVSAKKTCTACCFCAMVCPDVAITVYQKKQREAKR